MKKFFPVILFAILVAASAQAQNTMKKKPNWGFKTGINLSNIRINNGPDADWKTGLAAGLFFTIKAGQKFSVQPEFLYSSMGAKNLVENSDASLRLNYFSVPVLAKFQVKNKLAIVAGPQVDILIAAKTKNSNNQFTKATDNYRENSFNGTAGFEFWPCHSFGVTARYIYGFNNINSMRYNVYATNINPEYKNQGVQIMVALKL